MARVVAYQTSKVDNGVRVVNTNGLDFTSDNVEQIIREIIKSCDNTFIPIVWDSFKDFWEALFTLLPNHIAGDLERGYAGNYERMRLWWGITRHGRSIGLRADFREHTSGNFYNEERKEIGISEIKQYYDWLDHQTLDDTVKLGNELVDCLGRMGLNVKDNLTSAIAIFKENVLDKMTIPTIFSMPEETFEAHEMAYNAVDEWRGNYKSLPDEDCYSYDLTNAYGSALAELPDLSDADIIHSDTIMDGAYWGIFKATIHNKTLVSPMINPERQAPYEGFWKGFVPVNLYSCCFQWNIAEFDVKDGWYVFPKNNNKPFEAIMKRLYDLRNGDKLQNNLAKAMSVATWGKFHEERNTKEGKQYGALFNTIYASMVVSIIKTKVTDFIYGNKLQDSLVEVRVDGVKSIKDIEISTDRKFGEWRKEVK